MPDLKLDMMTSKKRCGRVVELSVNVHVSIRQADHVPGSAATFIDNLAPITDLMRLATFGPCGVEEITIRIGENDARAPLLTRIGDVARPNAHSPTTVVFTLADVPLGTYLQTWARLTEENQASYAWNVVVGMCGYSPRFTREYASQALAAAEGFHTWCLAGGDDMHLNARLQNLYERLSPLVRAKLNFDVDKWASWAVWARNHVAHGGVRRWRALEDGFQLHVIAQSVNLVTYLVALHQFSVPDDKVLDAVLNHPRLQIMAQQCRELDQLPDQR